MSLKGQSFSQILLESVDDSLSVLGEEPRMAVYQYLSTMHSLEKEDIPEKVEEFSSALKRALGGASMVIERLILRKLFQRLGSSFREARDLEFVDYVRDARRRYDILKQRHGVSNGLLEYGRSKKGQLSG